MSQTAKSFVTGLKYAAIAAKSAGIAFFNREASKKYLLQTLGSLPGMTTKAAQLLAMKLQDEGTPTGKVEAMPIVLVKKIIGEQSPGLDDQIDSIAETGITASLGQVHQAMLKNGDEVAIKLQFPNVINDITAQFKLLRGSSNFGPQKKYGMATDDMMNYFESHVLEETDYLKEASNQDAVRQSTPSGDPICVPKVFEEFSTSRILVQAFESSTGLATIKKFWPKEAKFECAKLFTTYLMHGLFRANILHSDPHPNNYGFRTIAHQRNGFNHELVLYDFGSVLEIDPEHSSLLYQLIRSHIEGESINPFDIFCSLGFDPEKLKYIAGKLPALCQKLLEPFLTPGNYRIVDWQLKERIEDILGEDKWWFRTAGPPWFLMLMRAMQGVLFFAKEIGEPIAFQKLFLDIDPPPHVPVKNFHLSYKEAAFSDILAKQLHVKVMEGNREIIALQMPARAVDELERIVPTDTLEKIESKGIDLAELKKDVQFNGYLPQTVFECEAGLRTYKVWLE